MYSPKIYGYGVAVVCAVIAVAPRICRGGHRGVECRRAAPDGHPTSEGHRESAEIEMAVYGLRRAFAGYTLGLPDGSVDSRLPSISSATRAILSYVSAV